jgi:hypothetical protein
VISLCNTVLQGTTVASDCCLLLIGNWCHRLYGDQLLSFVLNHSKVQRPSKPQSKPVGGQRSFEAAGMTLATVLYNSNSFSRTCIGQQIVCHTLWYLAPQSAQSQ